MNGFEVWAVVGLVVLVYMLLLWLASLALKNSSIVDIFWGAGFVVAGWAYFLLTPEGYLPRKALIMALVTIWGLRLSLYILWRNWGKPEDFRYQKWREEAPQRWWWFSFFKVFLLQGLLLWIISVPLLAAQISPTPASLGILEVLAVILWLIGFYFEAMGDLQLALFKRNPANKGKVLDSGVWRYTRHPNYFGDSAQWWGFYLLAVAAGGWWSIFSPVMMTALLLKVSGVALLEKTLKDTKPQYRQYIETTSSFIPWLPRKPKAGSS
jgi:steroid 5-alpha reductase family enzyme